MLKNRKKSNLLTLLITLIFIISFQAAPLTNVPIKLTQPDGTVLNVFASGDEFYNWVHDKDNYTIIPDPAT